MRASLALVVMFFSTTSAIALDTGNVMQPKPTTTYPASIPDPDRQGGDTIADAVVIPSLPFSDAGTTAGYTNDYDEVCPYTGSTAPDVVYSYTPLATETVTIDLCGSGYDTKLYVYDSDMNVVACNDDAYFGEPCGIYVSAIENLPLPGGETYFVVIDGYGNAFGSYLLDVRVFVPCSLECPADGFAEGEPPLVDDYVDEWNGGCNSPPEHTFQPLMGDASGNLVLCAVSGWYRFENNPYRDTDWYHLHAGPTGTIQVTADAEQPTYIFHIAPQDCAIPVEHQHMSVGDCHEESMAIEGYAADGLVWLWAGPTTFAPPDGVGPEEYDYVIWFSGLMSAVPAVSTTWSTVKTLFR